MNIDDEVDETEINSNFLYSLIHSRVSKKHGQDGASESWTVL